MKKLLTLLLLGIAPHDLAAMKFGKTKNAKKRTIEQPKEKWVHTGLHPVPSGDYKKHTAPAKKPEIKAPRGVWVHTGVRRVPGENYVER